MVAGDDCTFTDGTYDTQQSNFNSGSAAGGYIAFQAENPLGAELRFTDAAGGRLFDMANESYIRFVDLSLRGITTAGVQLIRMTDCDHIEFIRCDIYETRAYGIDIISCSNVLLQGCKVHTDNRISDYSGDGIQICGTSSDITIDGCEVYNCDHNGIHVYAVDGCIIRNCIVRDCQSHGISIGGSGAAVSRDVTVYGCRLSDAGSYDPTPAQEMGIRIHDVCHNIEVYNCDIEGSNGPGIGFSNCTGTVNVHDCTLYNNVINGSNWGSLFLENSESESPSITICNVIVYHTQASRTMVVASSLEAHVNIDYNLYYDSNGTESIRRGGTTYGTYAAYSAIYEPHSVFSRDPLFDNPATNGFTLQAASPAIDAGTNTGLPYHGLAPDIGAHEVETPPTRGCRSLGSLSNLIKTSLQRRVKL